MDIEAEMRRPGYESAQFSRSVMSDSLQPHGLQHTRLPLSITNSWSLLRLMSIESMMPSNQLIFFCTLLLLPFSSVQFSHSVMSDSLRPHGLQHTRLPVHPQLLELAQTHVHQVGDNIQPSHPMLSLSYSAFNLSQYQGLFQ